MLLRSRDLRLLFAAGILSQTGDWILSTGIAFQVYALTGSTFASAIVLLCLQIPQVVLSSPVGLLVDRLDRRVVMIVVNLLMGLVLIGLLWATRSEDVWIIYVVVAVNSGLSTFFVAAEAGLLPMLVPNEELLPTANATVGQVRNLGRFLGAALGGILLSIGGLPLLALIDLISFVAAASLVYFISHRAPRRFLVEGARFAWFSGLTILASQRPLVILMIFMTVSGLGEGAMVTLFAPFVVEALRGDALAFGTINSAQALGGFIGGFVVALTAHRFSATALFGWGAMAFGSIDVALFLYPLAMGPVVWPAIVLIALVGVPAAALVAGMMTVFKLATSDSNRGAVFGSLTAVNNAAMLIGTLAAGALASPLGIVGVISMQGFFHIAVGVIVLLALGRRR